MSTDKIETHYRQQLSAMLDGDLPPDQAKFLLRRLQHDRELADCWERWQLCGEAMRGRANALLPTDFAQRVASAIAVDAAPADVASATGRAAPRAGLWRWGGGAALAASVAAVALLIARQNPAALDAGRATEPMVAAATPGPGASAQSAPIPSAPLQPGQAPNAPAPGAVSGAATLAAGTAVAVAQVPRRLERRAASRGQRQRAALRASTVAEPPALAAAGAQVTAVSSTPAALAIDANSQNPFVDPRLTPARPWPRALLPGAASGAFNVDYGGANQTRSYDAFEPRLPPGDPETPARP